MNQRQTNFLNQNGIITQRQVNIEKFEAWMKEKVKNIYAWDNGKMTPAYDRID